jgi:hypothetical protein
METQETTAPKFDLHSLRLDPSSQTTDVEKVLTIVPVRKPSKQSHVRVHPDSAFRMAMGLIQLKEENETYIVSPNLHVELNQEITRSVLHTAIDRYGTVFLWPVKLPDIMGKLDQWNLSASIAAERATQDWVRMSSNRQAGCYEVFVAKADLGEPTWPDKTFAQLVEIAFQGYIITSLDHPVVKKLRGEV